MAQPKISLEQWRALTAVVEVGGYAQAAEALNKTQSTITYAVQKIESLLGLKIFEIQGSKAQLTREGEVLYQRAKTLLRSEERRVGQECVRRCRFGWSQRH